VRLIPIRTRINVALQKQWGAEGERIVANCKFSMGIES
jgi:hypothetical protein